VNFSNPNGADWTPGLMTGEPRPHTGGAEVRLASCDPLAGVRGCT